MKAPTRLTAAAITVAMASLPAAAIAQSTPGSHGKSQSAPGHTKSTSTTSTTTPGPTASPAAKAKAYGRLCQAESKKHVAGQKGTPFSNCVTAMAQLSKSSKLNPHRACATESKKHVSGQKGTPYSDCVKAAAKLRREHPAGTTTGSGTAGS